jgi:hypothetical protein
MSRGHLGNARSRKGAGDVGRVLVRQEAGRKVIAFGDLGAPVDSG